MAPPIRLPKSFLHLKGKNEIKINISGLRLTFLNIWLKMQYTFRVYFVLGNLWPCFSSFVFSVSITFCTLFRIMLLCILLEKSLYDIYYCLEKKINRKTFNSLGSCTVLNFQPTILFFHPLCTSQQEK